MASTGNLVGINISVCQVFDCKKKISMLAILNLSLPLKNQSFDLKNLQSAKWNEMTKKQKLCTFKFSINVTGSLA